MFSDLIVNEPVQTISIKKTTYAYALEYKIYSMPPYYYTKTYFDIKL